jgi:phenylalanyl-tRNA synthetase beta chain
MDGSIPKFASIALNPDFVSELLGVRISHDVVAEKLEIVGCAVEKRAADKWLVTPPSWRADLLTPADLTEEVARLVGYDQIPSTLPTGKFGATLNAVQARRRSIALLLADKGYSEVYNYPFVNQEMVDLLGFTGPRAASFKLANPMSDQAPLLRTHLLPGLLDAAKRNLSRGAKDVAIFEIGSVFRDVHKLASTKNLSTEKKPTSEEIENVLASVPAQPLFVGAVVTGQLDRAGWWGKGRKYDWSDATTQALEIIEATGNTGKVIQSDLAPWHPGRCAEIQVNGNPVAHAGELHPRVLEALGLPARTCAFAVILSELPVQGNISAPQVITMPAATQDVSLFVGPDIAAADVQAALVSGAGDLLENILLFDRFISPDDGKVSLAFTLTFRAPDRTLTAEEVSTYREAAVASAAKSCGAQVRA